MDEQLESNDQLMVAVFPLGETMLGIDADCIDEITAMPKLTPVRGAPDWVVGIGNLRNRIITLIDLGSRLGFGSTPIGDQTRIILTTVAGELIGILIPRLPDIVQVDHSMVRPVSNEMDGSIKEFFRGVLDQGDRLVALLDASKALGAAGKVQKK